MTIPPRNKFHLYLLLGQSNMAGRGDLPATPEPPNPHILVLNKHDDWAVAVDPLHFDKDTAGVGPGLSFAGAMLAATGDPSIVIGLVPCAVGGTPLERWECGADLFQRALQRSRIARQRGTLKGLLWHQGETDSKQEGTAASYGARLARMIRDLRAELAAGELPFVAGQINRAVEHVAEFPYAATVNRALADLPRHVPRSACVDSAGLTGKPDVIHFNTAAAVELGKRYAAAMIGLGP